MIDAAQIRAARGLLNISQTELAEYGHDERRNSKENRIRFSYSWNSRESLETSDGTRKGGCGVHPSRRPQGSRRATKTAVASQTKARARKSVLSCGVLFMTRGGHATHV